MSLSCLFLPYLITSCQHLMGRLLLVMKWDECGQTRIVHFKVATRSLTVHTAEESNFVQGNCSSEAGSYLSLR
jgi:hypothetical protein